jgi:Meiotically up-regulated gene 113
MLSQLSDWLQQNSDFADVAAMIPQPTEPASGFNHMSDGYVYLIQSGSHYKIGRSDDIERRMKEIRIALPDTAKMVHNIKTDDPAGIEAYWHRRFADRRANGEWFKLSTADVGAFKKRKFQ